MNIASILNVSVIVTATRNMKLLTLYMLHFAFISGKVMHATCTCAAGKVGYCNHTSALMLKICKYSLFESKTQTSFLNEDSRLLWNLYL